MLILLFDFEVESSSVQTLLANVVWHTFRMSCKLLTLNSNLGFWVKPPITT